MQRETFIQFHLFQECKLKGYWGACLSSAQAAIGRRMQLGWGNEEKKAVVQGWCMSCFIGRPPTFATEYHCKGVGSAHPWSPMLCVPLLADCQRAVDLGAFYSESSVIASLQPTTNAVVCLHTDQGSISDQSLKKC